MPTLLPILDPVFNIREICKQFVLLEDHLLYPAKRCPDCIRKHLLAAEALAEEAVSLDKTGKCQKHLIALSDSIRQMWKAYHEGRDPHEIAEEARRFRKVLMPLAAQVRVASAARVAERALKLRPDYGESDAALPRGEDLIARVAARYQKKKEVPKANGKGTTTVYEYSERQVQNRNRDKAERIEKLRGNMGKLRTQVMKDLTAEDPKVRLTALAVALMDETFERIGNTTSAEEREHFGVTTWKVEHVTLSAKKATIRYVGKSGVKHEKEVTTPKVLAALRAALKGKKKDEEILCEGDECRVLAEDVNEYLRPHDVTAKDIRGFHANERMKSRLKAVRGKGGTLPSDKKEREKKLKAEFKKALEETAEAVGHEASTLKSQYLVPGLEDAFLADGTVMEKLDKKASQSLDDPEWNYAVDTCPVCGSREVSGERGPIGRSRCENGHIWIWCHVHHVRVVPTPEGDDRLSYIHPRTCRCEVGV